MCAVPCRLELVSPDATPLPYQPPAVAEHEDCADATPVAKRRKLEPKVVCIGDSDSGA